MTTPKKSYNWTFTTYAYFTGFSGDLLKSAEMPEDRILSKRTKTAIYTTSLAFLGRSGVDHL
jgi:hypothetical protein